MVTTTVHTDHPSPSPTGTTGLTATSRRIEGSAAPSPDVRPAKAAEDHPGRWVGGAVGAGLSLVAAVVANALVGRHSVSPPLVTDWPLIALYGAPIGFLLGRGLLPKARSAGWLRALAVGLLLGLIAPPLGAIELLAVGGFFEGSGSSPAALILLPFAIPVSYVAAVMTVPIGLVWAVIVRLIPERRLVAARLDLR